MRPKAERQLYVLCALLTCFCLGALTDWWLRDHVHLNPIRPTEVRLSTDTAERDEPVALATPTPRAQSATSSERAVSTAGSGLPDPIEELHRHALSVPIDGVDPESLKGSFAERRGGSHPHEAVDILAPRGTPVHAIEDGTIAKLFYSNAGGTTIYQFDPTGRFSYYYAHLDRYAAGLTEGQRVSRGDIIGYVGTSGNAPPGTPHLHFAVSELTPARKWWEGRPLDPYLVFSSDSR